MKKSNKKIFVVGIACSMILGFCSSALATTLYVGSTGFNLDTALNDSSYNEGFRNYLTQNITDGIFIDFDDNGSAVSMDDFLDTEGQTLSVFESTNEVPKTGTMWNGTDEPGEGEEFIVEGIY